MMGPRPQGPYTAYQVSRSSGFWFWRRILKGFYHMQMEAFQIPRTKFCCLENTWRLQIKSGFDWPGQTPWEKTFENGGHWWMTDDGPEDVQMMEELVH